MMFNEAEKMIGNPGTDSNNVASSRVKMAKVVDALAMGNNPFVQAISAIVFTFQSQCMFVRLHLPLQKE